MRQARGWVTCIIIALQPGLLPDWQCLIACDRLKSAVSHRLESVSISRHSVALNKATNVGCFTVWGVAQIGVA